MPVRPAIGRPMGKRSSIASPVAAPPRVSAPLRALRFAFPSALRFGRAFFTREVVHDSLRRYLHRGVPVMTAPFALRFSGAPCRSGTSDNPRFLKARGSNAWQ